MECEIKDYHVETGVHCEISSVVNAIKNVNRKINESIIFFMEDGFSTKYSAANSSSIKDVLLSNHLDECLKSFLYRYNIGYEKVTYNKEVKCLRSEIENRVILGFPFIISVDTRYLLHNSIYKKDISRRHVISIFGFNNDGYIISDCYVPTSPISIYKGTMDTDALHKAWEATGKTFFEIDLVKAKKVNFNFETSAIQNAVKQNLVNFIVSQKNHQAPSDLKRFAGDLLKLTDVFSSDEIKHNIWELSFKIQFDSIIPSRRLLKQIIVYLIDSKETSIDPLCIDELERLLEMWKRITYMIIRAGFSAKKDYFKKISDSVFELIDYEVKLYEKICESL